MIRRLAAFAILAAAPAAAPAAAQAPAPALSVNYACAGGAVLQAAYLNMADGTSLAVVGWGGRLVPMQAGPTGSGVRYVAFDAGSGLVWHTKGDAGTLFHEEASGDQTALLDGCAAVAE